MTAAPINKIMPLSMVDGPGSRCAVFVQGCNLRCRYCHNPETQAQCSHCGACVPACPAGALLLRNGKVFWQKASCTGCDVCLAACPNNASPKVALMETSEVMAVVRESIPFIRGITVSGGECALYPEFLQELFRLAKGEGLGTLMDSNGCVDLAPHGGLLALCDGVMLDVKSWNDGVHKALTGQGSATVRRNLSLLAGLGKLEEVRIVHLPGHVDTVSAIDGVADSLGGSVGAHRLKLIRFRPYGVRGHLAGTPAPQQSEMEPLAALARARGFGSVVIT